jgi:ABC-type amino acid transport system permease subunit
MTPKPDKDFPWWLVILAVIGLWLFYEIWGRQLFRKALRTLSKGIGVTVGGGDRLCRGLPSGLGLAVMGMSRFMVLRQAARLYIEVMRGIPIIVLACCMWPSCWRRAVVSASTRVAAAFGVGADGAPATCRCCGGR